MLRKITAVFTALCVLFTITACRPTNSVDETTPTTHPYELLPFTPVTSTQQYFESMSYYDDIVETTIHYLFHKPLRDTGEAAPLVIFLHGRGDAVSEDYPGTATQFVESLMHLENQSYVYGAYTMVPITPFSYEGNWSGFQIWAFKQLIPKLIEQYHIDPKRVYISGISMGGFMTCQLVSGMPPDTFAAAVPLSGARKISSPELRHNTAFRIYHVATDPVVSVSSSQALYQELVEANHPAVEYIEYESGNHISPLYTVFVEDRDAFFAWLFNQRLP